MYIYIYIYCNNTYVYPYIYMYICINKYRFMCIYAYIIYMYIYIYTCTHMFIFIRHCNALGLLHIEDFERQTHTHTLSLTPTLTPFLCTYTCITTQEVQISVAIYDNPCHLALQRPLIAHPKRARNVADAGSCHTSVGVSTVSCQTTRGCLNSWPSPRVVYK